MKHRCKIKGSLTIEASLTYPLFLMIIVTILYVMRIVYTYGLIQHAMAQTAKELSMYTYLYQVAGAGDIHQGIQGATGDRVAQYDQDVENIVAMYEAFYQGENIPDYEGTTNPVEILKNIGSVIVGKGSQELNDQFFKTVVRPMAAGYIGGDSKNRSPQERLESLNVKGGFNGLDFSGSHFFEDGATIDIVVCYTIDPLFPINIMPEMHFANRACIRGMTGDSMF